MSASPFAFLRGAAAIMAEDFAEPARDRHPAGHLRRRPPGQLRLLRLARAGPGLRPQRLRRGAPRGVGVGPAPAGRERLDGRAAERLGRGRSAATRWPAACAPTATTSRTWPSSRCWNAPTSGVDLDRLRGAATDPATAARDRAGGAPRPPQDQRPRAAPVHRGRRDGRRPADRRGPAADHPAGRRPSTSGSSSPSTATCARCPPHWARVLGGYRVVDIAHKVVGVGSVGLRAYVALLRGQQPATTCCSCSSSRPGGRWSARFVHGDQAWHAHQGQRVVEYQQALQTVSDPLLGWTTVGDRQYYVRQFRDMKGAVVVDGLDAAALADYAGVCGLLLAKGHARTSGASMIAGYLGALGQGGRRAVPVRPPLRRPDRARPRRACSTRSAAASCRPNPGSDRQHAARTGDPMIHSARGVSRKRWRAEHTGTLARTATPRSRDVATDTDPRTTAPEHSTSRALEGRCPRAPCPARVRAATAPWSWSRTATGSRARTRPGTEDAGLGGPAGPAARAGSCAATPTAGREPPRPPPAPGARALLLRPGTPASARQEQKRRPHVVAARGSHARRRAPSSRTPSRARPAVGAALTFVHAVPRSFGERSVDLAGALARGQRLLDTAAAAAPSRGAERRPLPGHAAPAGAPARAGGRGARRRPAGDRRAPDRAPRRTTGARSSPAAWAWSRTAPCTTPPAPCW